MADRTLIAWTDRTMNFWLGCFKVSAGCTNCYADTLTSGRMGLDVFGHDVSKRKRTGPALWKRPFKWNREARAAGVPARVFCMSLGDFFEDSPGTNEWREDAWDVIRHTPWLDWQILTKRPENITKMLPDTWDRNEWGYWPNVWLGTSIEDERVVDRAAWLLSVPAIVHFVSYEPAIGPLADVLAPYMQYNEPVNENSEHRGSGLSVGDERGTPDPSGRDDLEGGSQARGPRPSRNDHSCMSTDSSGTAGPGGLPTSEGNDQRSALLRAGAQAGLPAFQGTDPSRADGQSRQRSEGRQQAIQSATGDLSGAGSTCHSGVGQEPAGSQPVGDAESRGQAGLQEGERDQASQETRRTTQRAGRRVRSGLSDDLENLPQRAPGARITWVICGGESGPGYRKMDLQWAFDMEFRCDMSGVAFFFKQNSGPRTEMGIDALGGIHRAYPVSWDRTYNQGRKVACA